MQVILLHLQQINCNSNMKTGDKSSNNFNNNDNNNNFMVK